MEPIIFLIFSRGTEKVVCVRREKVESCRTATLIEPGPYKLGWFGCNHCHSNPWWGRLLGPVSYRPKIFAAFEAAWRCSAVPDAIFLQAQMQNYLLSFILEFSCLSAPWISGGPSSLLFGLSHLRRAGVFLDPRSTVGWMMRIPQSSTEIGVPNCSASCPRKQGEQQECHPDKEKHCKPHSITAI